MKRQKERDYRPVQLELIIDLRPDLFGNLVLCVDPPGSARVSKTPARVPPSPVPPGIPRPCVRCDDAAAVSVAVRDHSASLSHHRGRHRPKAGAITPRPFKTKAVQHPPHSRPLPLPPSRSTTEIVMFHPGECSLSVAGGSGSFDHIRRKVDERDDMMDDRTSQQISKPHKSRLTYSGQVLGPPPTSRREKEDHLGYPPSRPTALMTGSRTCTRASVSRACQQSMGTSWDRHIAHGHERRDDDIRDLCSLSRRVSTDGGGFERRVTAGGSGKQRIRSCGRGAFLAQHGSFEMKVRNRSLGNVRSRSKQSPVSSTY